MSAKISQSKGDWVCSDSRYFSYSLLFSSDVGISILPVVINVINADVQRSGMAHIARVKKLVKNLLRRVEASSVLVIGSVKGMLFIDVEAVSKPHFSYYSCRVSLIRCGNVNWARRTVCNVCNAPKMNTQGQRTGYGGGYMERDEVVDYKRHDESDDEFDEVSSPRILYFVMSICILYIFCIYK